jgi:hypothetical protein
MLGVFQTTKWATRFNYAKSTRSRYGTRKFCFCLNTRKLFAACWKDDALIARFQTNPAEVLAEYGMDVPEGMNVNVVENSDTTVHITLPAAPDGHGELSDEELEYAGGGVQTPYIGCIEYTYTV